MLLCFECGNAIELRNGMMFDFYPGLPHIAKACLLLLVCFHNLGKVEGMAAESSRSLKRASLIDTACTVFAITYLGTRVTRPYPPRCVT